MTQNEDDDFDDYDDNGETTQTATSWPSVAGVRALGAHTLKYSTISIKRFIQKVR